MDAYYPFRGLLFEWDQEKARTNLKKHGVSFETACEVFLDPLVRLKDAGDANQTMQVVIGEALDERLLFVVHVIRNKDVIRIVSARPVTSHERREYEE
ncbi:MAG TPA: BrnT family toxin [Acidobacteriaceae bacterium]|nr:BrnT family toxin [Acidobacteriaceae bacterium]